MDPIHAQTGVAQPSATRGRRAGAGTVAQDLAMEGEPSARSIDLLCINTIRTLSMDAVQKANSGHPGTPMALAPVAYTLWQDFLRFDPADPIWPNRDRFVLSVGHASMLLYSLLHLTGVKAVDDDVRATRHAGRLARRHQAVPPARQQDARAIPNTT